MPHDIAEPEHPYPPRFWWARRLGLWLGALILLLLVLRLAWGWEADRRLGREIDKLRLAGQPVRAADLQVPPLPDARNAALSLRSAEQALNRNVFSPSQSNYSYAPYPPFPAQWHQMAQQAVTANTAALAAARQARQHPRADWELNLASPLLLKTFFNFNGQRGLANLIADAALLEHLRGSDFEALELIQDLRHQAVMLGEQPFLLAYLVELGIEDVATERIQVIAPGLNVTSERDGKSATREQVRGLIRELLDPAGDDALPHAIASERVIQIDTAEWAAESSWLLRPAWKLSAVRNLQRDQILMDAARQPTYPAAREVLIDLPAIPDDQSNWGMPGRRPNSRPPRYSRILDAVMSIPLTKGVNFRIQLDRRLAATALALRLYQLDHGRWPESLDALVPGYLPALPRDPFAVDAPLKWVQIPRGLPDGAARPLIYSVGENGIDDTARGALPPAEPQYGSGSRGQPDIWRDVSRWSPAPSDVDSE